MLKGHRNFRTDRYTGDHFKTGSKWNQRPTQFEGSRNNPKGSLNQIILQIEKIPPLDVFYNPRHKVVVKRQRKRRRTYQTSPFQEQTIMGNVVWKEGFYPSDDLTKLSQYAGAYSVATIDKALEVSLLLKTKDQEIFLLQAQPTEAQKKVEQAKWQLLTQQKINNQSTQQL